MSDQDFASLCLQLAKTAEPSEAQGLRNGVRDLLNHPQLKPMTWDESQRYLWSDTEWAERMILAGFIRPDIAAK